MAFIFDVAELAPGMGKSMGIYNYARRLFHAMLPLLDGQDLMHVTCNSSCAGDFDPGGDIRVKRHVVIDEAKPATVARQSWMRWRAQRFAHKVGADVYFSPKGFLPGWFGPAAGITTVAVLHDLIPLWYEKHFPGYFGRMEQRVVISALRRTALHADKLVLISQATAAEVNRQFLRRGGNMHVVHNGVSWIRPRVDRPVAQPYLMAVASALPHKNSSVLLSAYAHYRASNRAPLPLYVFGIADPGQLGVTAIQGADDLTLHTHYAHASLFIFLSLIEGFGFPPVEALMHGTPVLCSDISALREVTFGQATLVDPNDPAIVAQAIAQTLTRCQLIRQPSMEPDAVCRARFDWSECARQVLSIIRLPTESVAQQATS